MRKAPRCLGLLLAFMATRPAHDGLQAQQVVALAPVEDAYPDVGPDGRLVLQSTRLGGTRLFLLDSLGATPRLLPTGGTEEVTPRWSPDGRWIAFASTRDGNEDIYVLEVASGRETRLTREAGADAHPDWSPDGRQIVFNSPRGDGENDDIYMMDRDGTNVRRLTDNGRTWDTFPSFSPDGARILFRRTPRIRTEDGITAVNSEIMVMQADGSGVVNLSRDGDFDGWPAWSPDGRRIAFSSNRDDLFQIYVMRDDGTDVRVVAPAPYVQARPQWTPDGRWLVFNREVSGTIMLMRAAAPPE